MLLNSNFNKLLIVFFLYLCVVEGIINDNGTEDIIYYKYPTVVISIISRNEEHSLPTFLGYIERLNYPKDRISICIQTDHNEDGTFNVLSAWTQNVKHLYHRIILKHEEQPHVYEDARGPNQWTMSRYVNLLKLRQNVLDEARNQWADYLLVIDGDNFLLDPESLTELINQKKTIVAPMFRTFDMKSGYSNFWGGVNEDGYYKRVPEYFTMLRWELVGTFPVPMVHSTYLIHLRNNATDKLQFYPIEEAYTGALDDILIFADSAKRAGIPLHICNVHHFGYLMETYPASMSLEGKKETFVDTFIDYMAFNPPLIRSENVPYEFPTPTYAGFDEIFMINLKRRPDRYERMKLSLKELGLKWKYFEAVDGKNFTQEKVDELGVVPMVDFEDPYLKRPLTFGEIGCFMSHYYIWKEIIDRNLEFVLVLEDDVRFETNFRHKMDEVVRQSKDLLKDLSWDVMYFGRKHMSRDPEHYVTGSDKIVWAKYSYWTLGYVIRLSGAKKLINGNPLPKMVPVDEYIPIMFDEHPDTWLKERFSPRDLIGLSAEPLLIYPTHYIGDDGYVSDTEDTLTIQGEDVKKYHQKLENEKSGKAPKMQADQINPKEESRSPSVPQVTHGEL
ncbi:procollagen galactosyltransferase 1-A-like [Hydractinia symbiolongicarpus]|uniref:procollagen galactosyltransferase 1-A-like n=1 Tax=Hydractinia symbiolongicarpus TaxID=13093 RepID=UPI00254FB51B|nr:procollagen galactosyltransferase 1-A-like [Hydractinia symbiolongicarpus]